jgi:hypothetical protein
MTDPEVEAYNVRVGTQTFAGLFQFTTNTLLVETAQAIRGMGSDIIKFYLGGPDFNRQYRISLPASITNLVTLARDEPSCRAVLEMPFRHYILWTYCFTPGWWTDGLSADERTKEYNEMLAFARYLFTQYNNSGKTFYLGHWEGDWYLLPNYNTATNPSPTALQGMRDWLNTRQQAVDEARRTTPHTGVEVYLYTEANRVLDAMNNVPGASQRVINQVVPYVTNLDFVSWSSYDGQNLGAQALRDTLNYIESMLPTNKAAVIPGKRIFVGEYGWGGTLSYAAQEPPTRAYIKNLVQWGCPFVLFWEVYNNEPGKSFSLITPQGDPTPCYLLHARFANQARLVVARFKQDHGRLPVPVEFGSVMSSVLSQPLPAPVALSLTHAPVTELAATSVTLNGLVTQGIYGQEWARLFACWGTNDAGVDASGWAHTILVATNHLFGAAPFTATLTNLLPDTHYYFRFLATNPSAAAWSPGVGEFRTLTGPAPGTSPRLGISTTNQSVDLQWAVSATLYSLQTATNLRPPMVWLPVTNPPSLIGNTQRLLLPADLPVKYFRLVGS